MRKSKLFSQIIATAVAVAMICSFGSALATEPTKYEDGISETTALSQIKTTLQRIKLQLQMGEVSKANLQDLASQLGKLERAVEGSPSVNVLSIIADVENTIQGVKGNEQVLVALSSLKTTLGINSTQTTATPEKPAEGQSVEFADKANIPGWASPAIEYMSSIGLINGKPVDGKTIFDPQATMTRAEYLNIAVKALYQDELANLNATTPQSNWWQNALDLAVKQGLVKPDDPNFFDKATLEQGISREEMALILVRTAHAKGIQTLDLVYQTQIPDYKDVSPYYGTSVREAYSLGILNGVDQLGNFSPKGTLTRDAASQTFFKLFNADKRTPVAPQAPSFLENKGDRESIYKPAATLQTFNEGEPHTIPQAGDTVITKDGRTVVLTSTMIGGKEFVGYGQGVDIVTGVTINGVTATVGAGGYYDRDKTPFVKSTLSGEVYTNAQWNIIRSNTYPREYIGTEDGDIANVHWVWNTVESCWDWMGG